MFHEDILQISYRKIYQNWIFEKLKVDFLNI